MAEGELVCANCGRQLDSADKFCRDCGLPTMRQAQRQKQVTALPPDTAEMARALNMAAPEPKPFVRAEPPLEPAPEAEPLATSDVVKTTNPTETTKMATATTVMLVMIILFAILAVVFLVLALRA